LQSKIVILDGATLNPGDLSWECIQKLGKVSIYDRTSEKELKTRAESAQILLTNKVVIPDNILTELPDLKYIGVLATGVNVVNLELAKKQNIIVTNIPDYGSISVAQHVFALILEWSNRIGLHDESVHMDDWVNCPDFSFTRSPLIELEGLTLGIYGLGTIGIATARIAHGFGMNVIAYSRTSKEIDGIKMVTQNELFKTSDFISLHCPLTESTHGLINEKNLSTMKRTAYIINTSRGPIINENDLAAALNNKTIAGAALDVLYSEPPSPSNPLLKASNCIITPHIAWATQAARKRLMNIASNNIITFLSGSPKNCVN
jgi:glycerate dehydrogenase